MSDSLDDPNALLEMLHDMEPKPDTAEPGIVLRAPEWLWPWASEAIGKAEGAQSPMLKKHLRGLRFRSFTRDAAGVTAWERAAQDVAAYQRELAADNPILPASPARDPATSSTRIVRR